MTTRKKYTRLKLEALESRLNPSVTAKVVSGVLEIRGDGWKNDAKITETSSQIKVTVTSLPPSGSGTASQIFSRSFTRSDITAIKFWGYDSADKVVNLAAKPLYAWGGKGDDILRGGEEADNLYGGGDNDLIEANGGLDGVYGGPGSDLLYGGFGADRFLVTGDDGEALDDTEFDAVIVFRNGTKAWNASEIEALDYNGLDLLHLHVGNTSLLKLPNGGRLYLDRYNKATPLAGADKGSTTLARNYPDDHIRFYNAAFKSDSLAAITAIHEIGHNWDDEHDEWFGWKRLSDWNLVPTGNKSVWTHSTTAKFGHKYGGTDPFEDWATAWESYFTTRYSLPDKQDPPLLQLSSAKKAHLDAFFESLS